MIFYSSFQLTKGTDMGNKKVALGKKHEQPLNENEIDYSVSLISPIFTSEGGDPEECAKLTNSWPKRRLGEKRSF